MLAGIARAGMPVDQDWHSGAGRTTSATGTGGTRSLLADGFGGNVARQLFKMEFILQALTYPDIGEIIYTDADLDMQKVISDVRAMIAQGSPSSSATRMRPTRCFRPIARQPRRGSRSRVGERRYRDAGH